MNDIFRCLIPSYRILRARYVSRSYLLGVSNEKSDVSFHSTISRYQATHRCTVCSKSNKIVSIQASLSSIFRDRREGLQSGSLWWRYADKDIFLAASSIAARPYPLQCSSGRSWSFECFQSYENNNLWGKFEFRE